MKYLIINTESFSGDELPNEIQRFLVKYNNPFIVLDESSKIKTNDPVVRKKNKSKRNVNIMTLNKLGQRCILTGTFMSKSPVNAFEQMNFLKEGYFKEGVHSFAERYSIMMNLKIARGRRVLISKKVYDNIHKALVRDKAKSVWEYQSTKDYCFREWGIHNIALEHIREHEEYSPFMKVEEIYDRIKDDCMVVKKSDALDLPKKIYSVMKVPLSQEAKKLYNSLINNGFTDDVIVKDTISMYHRLQDICNGYIPIDEPTGEVNSDGTPKMKVRLERQQSDNKIKAIIEKVSEIDTNTAQVLIWSNRKLFLQDMYDKLTELGYACCKYDGDTSSTDKDKIKEDFLSKKIQIFIGNQASGAFGLDFLKQADYSLFASNDYSVETRVQCEDRIHRSGITNSKIIIDFETVGTIEERVAEALKVGKELINKGKSDKSLFELKEQEDF